MDARNIPDLVGDRPPGMTNVFAAATQFSPVFASEAKQSIGVTKEEWIASSLTLLAMTTPNNPIPHRHTLAISPRLSREFCITSRSSEEKREQGMPGARIAPAAACGV